MHWLTYNHEGNTVPENLGIESKKADELTETLFTTLEANGIYSVSESMEFAETLAENIQEFAYMLIQIGVNQGINLCQENPELILT